MTKLMATTCVMHLVERKQVTLDEDVRPLVPELGRLPMLAGFTTEGEKPGTSGAPILLDNTRPITLRQLLTHTAGLGLDVGDPDLERWAQHVGRTANAGSCTVEGWSTPLKFAPGEGWCYGTGVDWAGQVLERVSGMRLGEYMAEWLLKPLGLEDTGFFVNKVVGPGEKGRFVPLAERDETTGELKERGPVLPVEPPCDSGGAGLYSSAADYARVLRGLLKALQGEEGGVVKRETVMEMLSPQLNETERAALEGICWIAKTAAELPEGAPIDHGLGGMLSMGDVEGKRRKGSLHWSGMCNCRWVSRLLAGSSCGCVVANTAACSGSTP